MGLLIDIKKIEENKEKAFYLFSTPEGYFGEIYINKETGECFVVEEPEHDKESELAVRANKACSALEKGTISRNNLLGILISN